MGPSVKGLWAIVFCAILWSTSGLFIKIIDWRPSSSALLGGSIILAAVIASSIIGARKQKPGNSF